MESETSPKGLQLLDLPPEILFKIFSLVSTQDLLSNVAYVSKSFHSIARNPQVHRSVTFSPYCRDDNQVLEAKKFLRECVLMRELNINWDQTSRTFPAGEDYLSEVTNVEPFLNDLIVGHDHLKVVVVCSRRVVVSSTCFSNLGRATWWKNLETISLRIGPNKNPLSRAGYKCACETLAISGTLKHLDVKIPANHLVPIVLRSKNLVTLKNLNVDNHDDLKEMFDVIKSTIKDLEIISELSPESFELISSCHRLESLTIRSTRFTNLALVTKLENLRHLELPVSDSISADEFETALPPDSLPSLESASIVAIVRDRSPEIWEKSLDVLAKAAKNLKAIMLSANHGPYKNFPTVDISNISPFVENCSSLESILLFDEKPCQMDELTHKIWEKLPNLKFFYDEYCDISIRAAKTLILKYDAFILNVGSNVYFKSNLPISTVKSILLQQFQDHGFSLSEGCNIFTF